MRGYEPHEVGRDGYPPEWHTFVKHHVRELAGHRCVRCSHPFVCGSTPGEWSPCDAACMHGGPIRVRSVDGWVEYGEVDDAGPLLVLDVERQAQWRVLTVHHMDGNKSNCRWWNLAALCQRCHLTIQGKVRMERTWPWEHADWFKPYVAGFYAFTYLGEDLDRETTVARLDELLSLERMG